MTAIFTVIVTMTGTTAAIWTGTGNSQARKICRRVLLKIIPEREEAGVKFNKCIMGIPGNLVSPEFDQYHLFGRIAGTAGLTVYLQGD